MKNVPKVGLGARRMTAAIAVLSFLGSLNSSVALAGDPVINPPLGPKKTAGEPDRPNWVEAVNQTQTTGRPCVLVVTSKANPRPFDLVKTLLTSPTVAKAIGTIQIAELCADEDPEQVERLQVRTFPTFVAYRRNSTGGLVTAACYRGSLGPDEFAGWVRDAGLMAQGEKPSSRIDSNVARTGLFESNPPTASPQQVYAAPPPAVVRREVVVERPRKVERRVIRETIPETRVVRSYKLVPYDREITVNREVSRTVYVDREPAPAPRIVGDPGNILTKPSPQVERELIGPRGTPQEMMVEREQPREREVIVERVAPRRIETIEADDSGLNLIPPCFIGRGLGVIGDKLRYFSLPRVDVMVQTRDVYRSWPTHKKVRYVTEPATREIYEQSAPAPTYSTTPSAQRP